MTNLIETSSESIAKSASQDAYNFVKEWFKKIDPGGKNPTTYMKSLQPICDTIQIMGMSKAKRLTSVYVALRAYPELRKYVNPTPKKNELINPLEVKSIVENNVFDVDSAIKELGYSGLINSDKFSNVNALHDFKSAKDRTKKSKALQGIDVFNYINSNSRVVILGQPGSGKTTFLKTLALLYGGIYKLEKKTKLEAKIPIYIRLRDYSNFDSCSTKSNWFMDTVIDNVNSITSKEIGDWIKDQLIKGNCIVLVDGLDEIPKDNLKNLILSFRKFVHKFSDNKYVTTCRTSSYNFGLEGFRFCEVDDFNKIDIETFVNQWFDKKELSQHLIKDMASSKYSIDLMKTPLLATLVCIMYEQNRTLPSNRSELYESCIDALIYKWDSHRFIDRSDKVTQISIKQTKYLLSEVSRKGFEQNKILIHKHKLLEYINAEIKKLGIRIDPIKLLDDYEHNMGIIIERSPDIYCFSHLTFQEYFAAISYSENREGVKLAELAFSDARFKEVFLLCLERMYMSDEPILKLCGMIKHTLINYRTSDQYIQNLLSEITRSQANFSGNTRKLVNVIWGDMVAASINDQSFN